MELKRTNCDERKGYIRTSGPRGSFFSRNLQCEIHRFFIPPKPSGARTIVNLEASPYVIRDSLPILLVEHFCNVRFALNSLEIDEFIEIHLIACNGRLTAQDHWSLIFFWIVFVIRIT